MPLRDVPTTWVHSLTKPLFDWLEDARTAINEGSGGGGAEQLSVTFTATDTASPTFTAGKRVVGMAVFVSDGGGPVEVVFSALDEDAGTCTLKASAAFTGKVLIGLAEEA